MSCSQGENLPLCEVMTLSEHPLESLRRSQAKPIYSFCKNRERHAKIAVCTPRNTMMLLWSACISEHWSSGALRSAFLSFEVGWERCFLGLSLYFLFLQCTKRNRTMIFYTKELKCEQINQQMLNRQCNFLHAANFREATISEGGEGIY